MSARRGGGRGGMFADGAALGGSATVTALAGLLGWLIAARMLPQAQVGEASGFVNAFKMVAAISELGLAFGLLRWLPRAGSAGATLVTRCFVVTVALGLVVAAVWFLVQPGTIPAASEPLPWLAAGGLFVLGAVSWALFSLQDDALTGLGWARWVPVENVTFAVVRIGLLVALAPLLGALGIVLSWVVPVVIGVVVVTTLMLRRARRATGPALLPGRQEVAGLVGPAYTAHLAVSVAGNVIPLVAIARFGTEVGAAFFVVWTGLQALEFATTGFGNSLAIRIAADADDRRGLIRHLAVRVAMVLVPTLALAALLADVIMGLFGASYLSMTPLLRWVLLGFAARAAVLIVVAVHTGAGRGFRLGLLHVVNAAGLMVAALVTPDVTTIGVLYVCWQVLCAVGAAVDLARVERR
ncbi:hypothetical protein [Georgenia alba]|uniref:Membrane protein involved in the export of O-antigen and teichoic acid n=1 Tax=Georgenia alba TaxID=2233858 RepID=A0ABW2Q4N4_9MICO